MERRIMPEMLNRLPEAQENELWVDDFEAAKTLPAKSGRVILATDIGMRQENQDALFFDSKSDAFAVVDGMGGHSNGKLAAELLARRIRQSIKDEQPPAIMQTLASSDMRNRGVGDGGACYVAGRIEGKNLHVWWAGDCQMLVVNSISKDKGVRFITEPTSLYSTPGARRAGHPETARFKLANYDKIVLFSDGLSANVTLEDIAATVGQESVEVAIRKLKEKADIAMTGLRSDGNPGNKDNITVFIYEILPASMRQEFSD